MSEYEELVTRITELQVIRRIANQEIAQLECKAEQIRYAEFDLPTVPGWYLGENSDAPICLDIEDGQPVWHDGYGSYVNAETVVDEGPMIRLVPEEKPNE